jgi:hypothetical protein
MRLIGTRLDLLGLLQNSATETKPRGQHVAAEVAADAEHAPHLRAHVRRIARAAAAVATAAAERAATGDPLTTYGTRQARAAQAQTGRRDSDRAARAQRRPPDAVQGGIFVYEGAVGVVILGDLARVLGQSHAAILKKPLGVVQRPVGLGLVVRAAQLHEALRAKVRGLVARQAAMCS